MTLVGYLRITIQGTPKIIELFLYIYDFIPTIMELIDELEEWEEKAHEGGGGE